METRNLENQAEFKEASRVATAFKYAANRYLVKLNPQGRLTAKFLEVIKADDANVRGERKLLPGKLSILNNYNIGINSVQSMTYNPFAINITDKTGDKKAVLTYSLPLVPATDVKQPKGATHVNISLVLVAVDFNNTDNLPIIKEKKESLLLNSTTPVASIETELVTVPAGYSIFALKAVHFAQEVNGTLYPLDSKALNSAYIGGTLSV